MRLGDAPESGNFEDRTGQSGGGGGGLIGLLLPIVASRFGIIGVLVLGLGYCALTSFGGGGGSPTTTGESQLTPEQGQVLRGVLGSTEQVWGQIFQQSGAQYKPTRLVAYSNQNQSGCGVAQAAMGPFYCPSDQSIYIDPQFFSELARRFQAPGDGAQAYVIAHEVGHHIQNLTGVLDKARAAQSRASSAEGNAIQVRVELQADCYAGVWAANDQNLLEPGDVEEGLRAAEAIGDDTLQRQSQGRVTPESFTHGSAAQRMQWLQRGLTSGDPGACDTFKA